MSFDFEGIIKQVLEKLSIKNLIIVCICTIILSTLSFFMSREFVLDLLLNSLNKEENIEKLAGSLERFNVLNELIDRRIRLTHINLSGTIRPHKNVSYIVIDTEYYSVRGLKLIMLLDAPAVNDIIVKWSLCDTVIYSYTIKKGEAAQTERLWGDKIMDDVREFYKKCAQSANNNNCYECTLANISQEAFLRISATMNGKPFIDYQAVYALYVYPKHITKE
jgi:hypothetical protein